MNKIVDTTNRILCVYFTTLPYSLYNYANLRGNFAYLGISLGFINCQRMFWISNFIISFVIYNRKNVNFHYLNVFLFYISIYLYLYSFFKIIYLIKFFEK